MKQVKLQNRENYRIRITLLSEAIFSSGAKEPNLVQSRVLTDQDGFVYFHAKTLKGQMKRSAMWILRQYAELDSDRAIQFFQSIVKIFGFNREELENLQEDYSGATQGTEPCKFIDAVKLENNPILSQQGMMKLGHLELPRKVRDYFKNLYDEQLKSDDQNIYLSRHDLIEAQTHIRTGIQLDDGVVKDGMFTSYHTVRQGLIFYAPIIFEQSPEEEVLWELARIVRAMDWIGAGVHRGRGEIKAQLLALSEDGEKGDVKWDEVSNNPNFK
ncbi:hypothetical protein D3C76_313220 [compost metagenome]